MKRLILAFVLALSLSTAPIALAAPSDPGFPPDGPSDPGFPPD